MVVVLPEPWRPTIRIGTGGRRRCEIGWAVAAEHGDELVVDDLDDLLAGRDRFRHRRADGAFGHALHEVAHHVERDIGLEQRAAHLAHGLAHVALRESAASAQLVEYAAQAVL